MAGGSLIGVSIAMLGTGSDGCSMSWALKVRKVVGEFAKCSREVETLSETKRNGVEAMGAGSAEGVCKAVQSEAGNVALVSGELRTKRAAS
jgi:hypothetical protein